MVDPAVTKQTRVSYRRQNPLSEVNVWFEECTCSTKTSPCLALVSVDLAIAIRVSAVCLSTTSWILTTPPHSYTSDTQLLQIFRRSRKQAKSRHRYCSSLQHFATQIQCYKSSRILFLFYESPRSRRPTHSALRKVELVVRLRVYWKQVSIRSRMQQVMERSRSSALFGQHESPEKCKSLPLDTRNALGCSGGAGSFCARKIMEGMISAFLWPP